MLVNLWISSFRFFADMCDGPMAEEAVCQISSMHNFPLLIAQTIFHVLCPKSTELLILIISYMNSAARKLQMSTARLDCAVCVARSVFDMDLLTIFHLLMVKNYRNYPSLKIIFHFFSAHSCDRKDGRCSNKKAIRVLRFLARSTLWLSVVCVCVFVWFFSRFKKINVQKWFKFGNTVFSRSFPTFVRVHSRTVSFSRNIFTRTFFSFLQSFAAHFCPTNIHTHSHILFYFIYTFRWLFVTNSFLKE